MDADIREVWSNISKSGTTFVVRGDQNVRDNGYFRTVDKGYGKRAGPYIATVRALLPHEMSMTFFYKRELQGSDLSIEPFEDPFQERLQLDDRRLRIRDRDEHIIDILAEDTKVIGVVDGHRWTYENEIRDSFNKTIIGVRFHGTRPRHIIALIENGRGVIGLNPYTGEFIHAYNMY